VYSYLLYNKPNPILVMLLLVELNFSLTGHISSSVEAFSLSLEFTKMPFKFVCLDARPLLWNKHTKLLCLRVEIEAKKYHILSFFSNQNQTCILIHLNNTDLWRNETWILIEEQPKYLSFLLQIIQTGKINKDWQLNYLKDGSESSLTKLVKNAEFVCSSDQCFVREDLVLLNS